MESLKRIKRRNVLNKRRAVSRKFKRLVRSFLSRTPWFCTFCGSPAIENGGLCSECENFGVQ